MSTRQKVIRSLIPAFFLALLALFLAHPGNSEAAEQEGRTPLPPELLELLPEAPHILVTVTSLNELDAQYQSLRTTLSLMGPPGAEDEMPDTLAGLLEQSMPGLLGTVDRERPFAYTVRFPSPMSQEETSQTLVLPLRSKAEEFLAFLPDSLITGSRPVGRYLALDMGATPPAAAQPCRLADKTPAGTMTMAVDLAGLVEPYLPMIEMQLSSLAGGALNDSTRDSTASQPPAFPTMDPDQGAELAQSIRSMLESLDVLGYAMDLNDDGMMQVDLVAHMVPGSLLAPAPQPSFAEAVELTRLLPDGSQMVFASAFDLGPAEEWVLGFYSLYFTIISAFMPGGMDDGLATWYDESLKASLASLKGSAFKVYTNDGGFQSGMVMTCEDPSAAMNTWADLLENPSLSAMGWQVTPRDFPLAQKGIAGRSWDFSVDLENVQGYFSGMGYGQHRPSPAFSPEQAAAISLMMNMVMPAVNMCATDKYLIFTTEPDGKILADILAATRQSRLAVDPDVARLARQAGSGCQSVGAMDLSIMQSYFPLMAQIMGTSSETLSLPELESVPMVTTLTIEDNTYHFWESFDLVKFARLMEAMQQAIQRNMPQQTMPDFEPTPPETQEGADD